jgi:Na+/H+-translocating membrane pyrophosphatase
VGDNVGDIAGMGADLFGSFAEATCAALVVSSGKGLLQVNRCCRSIAAYAQLLSLGLHWSAL